MDVDVLASTAFDRVPGALLAGVVDMATGMFLSLRTGGAAPEETDLLAVSAREVFDGILGAGLRQSFLEHNDQQQLTEVIVIGDKTVFVLSRVLPTEDAAIVVACDKKTNLGMITMVIAKIRDSAELT
jgi:predicted regulator of Ras-like GTPase activity (Roadblock/LC7/MglB family)